MDVFHNVVILCLLTLNLINQLESKCILKNKFSDYVSCGADIYCTDDLSDLEQVVEDLDCFDNDNDEYTDYEYLDLRRLNKTMAHNYYLNIQTSNINDYLQFKWLGNVRYIRHLLITNGNLVSLPNVSDLKTPTEIEITKNLIENFNLENFFYNFYLEKINVSHNMISSLQTTDAPYKKEHLKSMINLDLSYNLIDELPKNFFSLIRQLKYLNLSHNRINSCDYATFEGITQLQELYLSYNKIKEIGSTFVRLVNLKTLSLDNNRLTNIIKSNLVSLEKLEILYMSNNSIEKIEDLAFQSLSNMENIDLSYNHIEIVTVSLFKNNNKLKSVFLGDNNIKNIESGSFIGKNITNFFIENNNISGVVEKNMFNGINAKVLNFSGQSIEFLGDEAFCSSSKNIFSLNFTNNKLTNVSKFAFKSLNILTELDLSNNLLSELNFETKDLHNLSLLYAPNNIIEKIQKAFFTHLISLTILNLSNNLISEIEIGSFHSLNNLEKLILNDNVLGNSIDSYTFKDLTSLNIINLMNSRVQNYKNSAFYGMTELTSVNGSYGQLTNIEYDTFDKTGAIEVLDFSYNLLENFAINMINMRHLKKIFLKNNKLRKINNDTFFGLHVLQVLDLSHNNIIEVDSNAFNSLTNLLYLELFSNPELEIKATIFDDIKGLSKVTLMNTRKTFDFKDAKNSSVVNLQLQKCNIVDINKVYIYNIKNIVELNLSWNKISSINKFSFTNMYSLIFLDLSFNAIKDIQPGSFLGTGMINYLNLHSNYIETMQFGVLNGLEYLQCLNLSSNLLSSFKVDLLHKTPRLSTLILDDNLINIINFYEFQNRVLEVLSIGGNPIPCSKFVSLITSNVKFTVTAENLDYHSENVNGIACKTDTKIITDKSFNTTNMTSNFDIFTNTIKELIHSVEAFANKTTTNKDDIKNNFVNVASAVDRLASYSNKSQEEFNQYLKTLTDINNETQLNLKHIGKKIDIKNLTPIIKNFSLFEKENMADLKKLLQSWQNSLNKISEKNKGVEDIKVLLYFMSVCMGIMLGLVLCYLLFRLVKGNASLRSNSILYKRSCLNTNSIEME